MYVHIHVCNTHAHRDDSADVRASPSTIYKRSVAIFRAIEYKAYRDCCVPFCVLERLLEGYKTSQRNQLILSFIILAVVVVVFFFQSLNPALELT